MSLERQLLEHKSLRAATGRSANWDELAKDCIAFANAAGGRLLLGIEDGQEAPPAHAAELPDVVRRTPAEREGSGFDKVFEALLSPGRPAPELIKTHDPVQVTVRRGILKPEVIDFIARAYQIHQLTQRERIALGLLAQQDALTARELAAALELPSTEALLPWLKRLLDWRLVLSTGRTQATRYFIDPGLLRSLNFTSETTLKRIEPHRLAALVLEDLQRYPKSAISEIHQRIGGEIHAKHVKRALEELIERGEVRFEGDKRWRRYWAVSGAGYRTTRPESAADGRWKQGNTQQRSKEIKDSYRPRPTSKR